MTDRGWRREFDDPILSSDGRTLSTLHDAATFITKLRKQEHDAPEWLAAIEALLLVVSLSGPTMFARIAVCVRSTAITSRCSTATEAGEGVSGGRPSAPSFLNFLRELDPISGKPKPSLFVNLMDSLSGQLTALLSLFAKSICVGLDHRAESMHPNRPRDD
ncbi:hypothetical protein [Bradyrhizobium nanningense]|uniref:hypothetical protein n=1 Tax=Bradyrhizobium nanningense TaxID=1325118 RepID=UPI001FE103B4|nr:hypothetical protein [Bradyrhizobium nanningense]